jgi:hypothetical protein
VLRSKEPKQYFNVTVLLVPFIATAKPRSNLALQMMRQSMSLAAIKADATFVSLNITERLVTTDFVDAIALAGLSVGVDLRVPKKPVTAAFVNSSLNTEDSVSVFKE